ncbi:MAG: hypothetical protein NC222_06860 [Staphylococcus sp.]|nr:hypothetical protein [Staphylococcus sp.]
MFENFKKCSNRNKRSEETLRIYNTGYTTIKKNFVLEKGLNEYKTVNCYYNTNENKLGLEFFKNKKGQYKIRPVGVTKQTNWKQTFMFCLSGFVKNNPSFIGGYEPIKIEKENEKYCMIFKKSNKND